MSQPTRPATARPPPVPRPPSHARARSGGMSARRPVSAVTPSMTRRSSMSPSVAFSSDDDDSSSTSAVAAAPSRFISDRPIEVEAVVADMRASVSMRSRYAEYMPPSSPFLVEASALSLAPSPSPVGSARPTQSRAVRKLYDLVDGRRSLSRPDTGRTRPDVPPLFRPDSSPPVAPSPRPNADASLDSAAPLAYAAHHRPMSHNFTDGTAKTITREDVAPSPAVADSAPTGTDDDDDIPLDRWGVPIVTRPKMTWGGSHDADLTFEEKREQDRMRAEAEAKRLAEEHSSPHHARRASARITHSRSPSMSPPPDSSRSHRPGTARNRSGRSSARRPLHPTRPGSAYSVDSSSVIDFPSRERNRLWTKYAFDAAEEVLRLERAAAEPTPLDQSLQLRVRPHLLHDPASNHALQGMKLASDEHIAELENAPPGSDDEVIPREALSEEDESDDDDDNDRLLGSDGGTRRSSTALEEAALAAASTARASEAPIDFARVGVEVAKRLKAGGFDLSQSHLDVLHSLPLLERVWLASHTRGFGLNEAEFVDFLSSASTIRPPTLAVLFEKMDVNSVSRLGWDEYLSYLVRELACKWRMAAGAGTYVLAQDESASGHTRGDNATVINQMLLLPQVGNSLFPTFTSKLVARCKNDTIQVFDTRTLAYLYHVPLHAPVKKRKKVWSYSDDARATDIAEPPTRAEEKTQLIYNVDNARSRGASRATTNDEHVVDPAILEKIQDERGWGQSYRAQMEIKAREVSHDHEGKEEDEDEEDDDEHDATATRSSIRHLPKSPAGRPESARGPSGVTTPVAPVGSSSARRPRTAGSASLAGRKHLYESVRDRKLESYLAAVELASATPIAHPLACVGQMRASGRPPPAERPATVGGVMHREVLDLQLRNQPYSFALTAVAHFEQRQQIIVAAQDRSLRAFGLVRRTFECQDKWHVHETPHCLEVAALAPSAFVGMHGRTERAIAIVGAISGSVTAYDPTSHARVASIAGLHGEQPVRKVQLFPHVGLVTAGMDGRLAIVDPVTFQCTRYLGRAIDPATTDVHTSSAHGHSGGVFSFALCPLTRTLLSVGFDREVCMWDPHLSSPTWKLPPQNNDLLDVLVNESRHQLILVSRDQKVRVFDTRNFKPLQETLDATEYFPPGRLSACVFDAQKQELFTAANKISLWHVEPSLSNKAALASEHAPGEEETAHGTVVPASQQSQKAHVSSIVAMLYSHAFQQVVTVCDNASVRVWDMFNGCRGPTFEFSASKHRAQVTAASLDWNGKRLLTACHAGRIFMWNFNNGELLYSFSHPPGGGRIEISQVCLLSTISQCLVAVGWSKNVLRWQAPLSALPAAKSKSPGVTEQVGHSAQVLSLAVFGRFIVTGDANGELISWLADSGQKVHAIKLPPTSQQHKVHRDAADARTGTGIAPPIVREPCAPAVTCLEFFLVHDEASYDSWYNPDQVGCARPSSSFGSVSHHHPPDYRQQHLHAHRAALFVGTDDGSVYIISPQGLSILHSSVHLMPDSVQAMALLQTMHEEEIIEVAPLTHTKQPTTARSAAPSRRASLTRRTSGFDDKVTTAFLESKSSDGSVTKSGLEAALHRSKEDPAELDGSRSAALAATPRIHNPFALQKKTVFRVLPKVVSVAPPVETDPLEDEADQLAGALADPNHKPFDLFGYRAALANINYDHEHATDDVKDAQSIEDFLRIKKTKARAEAGPSPDSATTSNTEVTPPASVTPDSAVPLPAAAAVIESHPVPPTTKLSLLVDQLRLPKVSFRRTLRRRLLVSDGMAGSDAKLLDLTCDLATMSDASLYHGSPSLVDMSLSLTPVTSLYLHSPPSVVADAQPENIEDSTTSLHAVAHPALGVDVFLVASARGHATVWSGAGEWLAEFGQAASKSWPVKRPTGLVAPSPITPSNSDTHATPHKWSNTAAAVAAANRRVKPVDEEEHTDDAWSDGDDALTEEEERALLAMQSQSLGFAADDSSITAMLASVRKKKINNDGAKRGMVMGASFLGAAKSLQAKNTAEFGGGGLGGPGNTATSETNVPERPQTARSEKQRARHRRLLESPRLRYVESFRPRSARAPAALIGGTAGSGAATDAPESRTYAQQHPFYVPETLRAGGLRSAMFINDSKMRARAVEAASRARARGTGSSGSAGSRTNGSATATSPRAAADLNFFQLAPRDQAAAREAEARHARAMFVDNFLSDPANLIDEEGGVRDHAVARLAIKIGAVDAAARRKTDSQTRGQTHHVRTGSTATRRAKENVFTRLSQATTHTSVGKQTTPYGANEEGANAKRPLTARQSPTSHASRPHSGSLSARASARTNATSNSSAPP